MRRLANLSLAASLLAAPALAQTPPAKPATPPAPADATSAPADKNPNPVVATVNGIKIYFSQIQEDAQSAPQQLQQLPPDQLFPLLVSQEIDRKALLIAAQKENLQKDPQVAQEMQDAANIKLENASVRQQVTPQITDAAVQAYYDKNYKGKPGPEQVKARHILVKTEKEADAIIDQLNKGANFADLAKKDSLDPGAANGGELGWFSKDEMVPAFADAAFALKPGEYTKKPVQTQFGYHIILCEGKRTGPTPSLTDVQGQIRQTLADDAIKATLAKARSAVKIQVFDANGKATTPPPEGQ